MILEPQGRLTLTVSGCSLCTAVSCSPSEVHAYAREEVSTTCHGSKPRRVRVRYGPGVVHRLPQLCFPIPSEIALAASPTPLCHRPNRASQLNTPRYWPMSHHPLPTTSSL